MNCIPGDVKVNMTGKAELGPKNELGFSYLKLVEIKLKGSVGDATGRLVDTTKNPENSVFGKYSPPQEESNNVRKVFFFKNGNPF